MGIKTILICLIFALTSSQLLGQNKSIKSNAQTKIKKTTTANSKKTQSIKVKEIETTEAKENNNLDDVQQDKTTTATTTSQNFTVNTMPFYPGEKMEYSITWGVIPAGTAIFKILPFQKVNEVKTYHFNLIINTNSFVDIFYKVRDDINSFTDAEMTRAMLFKKIQREGGYHRDYEVKFDWLTKKVVRTNYGKLDTELTLEDFAFDPLSIFYSFRFSQLEVGQELSKQVTDGEKAIPGKIKIVKKEIIKVPAGEFEAFMVEPDLRNIGGVFKQSDNSKLYIWVSTDNRKIPVRIQSEVAVGSFYADLVNYQEGTDRAIANEE